MKRVGILISGSGSNMVAVVRAMQAGVIAADPAVVISNRPAAAGLEKAAALGVPTAVVDHRSYKGDRAAFDSELTRVLRDQGTDIVVQAGFLRIHAPAFPKQWGGRIVNIHPSLLPSFKGLHTHAAALEAGVAIHGCTVHEVVVELDAGPILGQAAVPVLPDDTPETLAARVLKQEHRLYPAVLKAFVEDADSLRANPVALFPEGA